jgi:hypothetical protein
MSLAGVEVEGLSLVTLGLESVVHEAPFPHIPASLVAIRSTGHSSA